VPHMLPKGHGRVGVGSMYGMDMMHHTLIYELYIKNPLLPLHGYIEEMYHKYGLLLHISSLTERWFMTIGPFIGTMRLTSRYPSGRDTWITYRLLKKYLRFICSISDHQRGGFCG